MLERRISGIILCFSLQECDPGQEALADTCPETDLIAVLANTVMCGL